MQIVGIDQGTTSTRAIAVMPDHSLRVLHSLNHKQHYPQTGWVEHDPEELIANISSCIKMAVASCGPLDAIGIDNQGESCLAWDAATKEALSPVIIWQDTRTSQKLVALQEQGAEEITLARAGLPLDPYFSASKLGWILDTLPRAQAAHKEGRLRLGTTDAFFLDRLCGHFVTDVTTASRTSLMNLETLKWDEELCALFGVPLHCLPEIVSTTGIFGHVTTSKGPVPVTASVVDQQAALYGFGCRKKGDAKITFGTGAFALMVTGEQCIQRPDLGLLPTVAWQLEGQAACYALDGGVFSASAAVNWAKSLDLFEDFESINSFQGPTAIEGGLVFVPALAGLGCPHWEPQARGGWFGLSLDHKPEHLVQAVLEGVALRASEVIEAMHDCVPMSSSLPIDGGMSTNPYFVQFLADVTGRVIERATMPEMTGLGTLQLAADPLGASLNYQPEFVRCPPKRQMDSIMSKFRQAVLLTKQWVHYPG